VKRTALEVNLNRAREQIVIGQSQCGHTVTYRSLGKFGWGGESLLQGVCGVAGEVDGQGFMGFGWVWRLDTLLYTEKHNLPLRIECPILIQCQMACWQLVVL
jgi:hypothetical protein